MRLGRDHLLQAAAASRRTGEVRLQKNRGAAARRLAHALDDLFRIPGTSIRFGLDPLLGLIPGGGDIAGGAMASYIILTAARFGAPPSVLLRMTGNVMIDTLLGTIPLVGDLFDAGWKANKRNALLLQQFVDTPAPVQTRSRIILVLALLLLLLTILAAAGVSLLLIRWVLSLF
jgi:hypothetical protein